MLRLVEAGQRAIAYIRVSVVGDRAKRGRFESPDLQRESIDGWCAQRAISIVEEIRDLNRSGGTLTRPGLEQALDLVRSGAANGIVVARSDRASRRTVDGLGLIDTLEHLGGWIAAADGTIDTTDRVARMATTMMFAVGQHELDRYREQSAVVHERAILEKGRHMGPTPFGYRRGEDGRLVLDEERAPIVVSIFERRADGMPWATLSDELTRDGVRRENGRKLSAQQVRRMVKRRVYVGEASHGQHVKPGAHPAIVSEALWTAANRAAPGVRAMATAPARHGDSLLRGLLRCAGCRYAMKRVPQPNRPPRWQCRSVVRGQTGTHDCEAPARIRQTEHDVFNEWVVEQFKQLATEQVAGVGRDSTDEMPALERRLSEEEAMLDELSSLELRRELGAGRWNKLVREARDAVEATKREIAAGRARQQTPGVADREVLDEWWSAATLEERQAALRSIVQTVMVVAGDAPITSRLHIVPVWETIDLPRTGSEAFVAHPWLPGA